MKKNEKQAAAIAIAGAFPGFEYGGQRNAFLNLGLEVEIGGVTYHLHSKFSEKSEMGEVLEAIELERSQRKSA